MAFAYSAGNEAELISVSEEVSEVTSGPNSLARFVTFYRLYKARGVDISNNIDVG